MSTHQTPNGKWRVQLRSKHFPRFDHIFDTEEQAIAAEKEELAQRSGLHDGIGSTMTLRAAAENYLNSRLFSAKAAKTQYDEKNNLKQVLAKLGDYQLAFLAKNSSVISGYADKRSREKSLRNPLKKVGDDKIRVELAALSSVFIWAVERKLLITNPVVGIKRGNSKMRERRYEKGEESNLLRLTQAGEPWQKEIARFLLLLLEVGCRCAELKDCPYDEIDLGEALLVFRDTKNGTDRTVHLTPVALEMVIEQLLVARESKASRLFWTIGREGLEGPYRYQHWINRLKKLGIVRKDFIAYAGRKEFVSLGFENGMNIGSIQMQTGHGSLQALERYKVGIRPSKKVKETFNEHSANLHQDQLEKTLAGMPADLASLFKERKKR